MMYRYKISGLNVVSDYPIKNNLANGWQEANNADANADICIQTYNVSDHCIPALYASKTEIVFQAKPGLVFKVSNGSNISIYRVQDVDDRDVMLFLVGSAWGALCHQRELLPLHCSAVASGSKAFAFIGPTGAGKSTLAASLCRYSYGHVCDDVAIIDTASFDNICVRAMPKGLKLWQEAAEALGLERRGLVTSDGSFEKYYVTPPHGPTDCTLDLAAIYLLDFNRDITEPKIRKVEGASLLQSLYANIYRVEWLGMIRDPAQILSQVHSIAKKVPVYSYSRSCDLDSIWSSSKYLSNHMSILTE